MDYSPHPVARLCANGQNRPALAEGRVQVLKVGPDRWAAQTRVHAPLDLSLEIANARPQPAQIVAGIPADLAFLIYGPRERPEEIGQIRKGASESGQSGVVGSAGREEGSDPACRLESREYGREVSGGDEGASPERRQGSAQVDHPSERGGFSRIEKAPHLRRLRLSLPNRGPRRLEEVRSTGLRPPLGRGLTGEALREPRPLETQQGPGVASKAHGSSF